MANVQKEKGHTGIANELLEAIIQGDFTDSEYKIILFVIRKTYGYHKKIDKISIGQFVKDCKLPRSTVKYCLGKLGQRAVLLKDRSEYITKYGIQKDYDRWKPKLGQPVGLGQLKGKTRPVQLSKLGQPTGPTKDIKITKERDIKKLIEKGRNEYYKKKGTNEN